jgi:hypothetical protein
MTKRGFTEVSEQAQMDARCDVETVASFLSSFRECGEALFENGNLVTWCLQPWGSEHSHSDLTATQVVQQGLNGGREGKA